MNVLLQLTKARISLLVAFSAATGYWLAAGSLDAGVLWPTLATLLLAAGASALNQVQEWDVDARMQRTRLRPIPSGRIAARVALVLALALIGLGLALLVVASGPAVAGLGLLTVVWYNGLYTNLKRTTRFAAVPGAVIGALPPAIGWLAAGGDPASGQLLALMFFLFLWQVPHFWLLLLLYPADYRRAGLPSLSSLFSRRQISRITFVWTAATALSILAFPLFGLMRFLPVYALMAVAALWLCVRSARLLGMDSADRLDLKRISVQLNAFALLTLLCLVLDLGVQG